MKKVSANKKLLDTNVQNNMQGYVVFESIDSVEKGLKMNNTIVKDDQNEECVIRVDTVPPTINNDLSIFIGNLTYKVTEQKLRLFFEQRVKKDSNNLNASIIQNIRVVRDNKTNLCKGVAYILLSNYGYVKQALKLNGTLFEKRELRIMRCNNKNKNSSSSSSPHKKQRVVAPGAMRRIQKKSKKSETETKNNNSKTLHFPNQKKLEQMKKEKNKKPLVRRKTIQSKHNKRNQKQRPSGVTKRAVKEKKAKVAMKKVQKRVQKQDRRNTKKS